MAKSNDFESSSRDVRDAAAPVYRNTHCLPKHSLPVGSGPCRDRGACLQLHQGKWPPPPSKSELATQDAVRAAVLVVLAVAVAAPF